MDSSTVSGQGHSRPRPFEAWSQVYPGEYGAKVEIEIRRVFEPES